MEICKREAVSAALVAAVSLVTGLTIGLLREPPGTIASDRAPAVVTSTTVYWASSYEPATAVDPATVPTSADPAGEAASP